MKKINVYIFSFFVYLQYMDIYLIDITQRE